MHAASENDNYLVNLLLSFNCNINMKDNNNRNALFYAINSNNSDNIEMINNLIMYLEIFYNKLKKIN